VFEVVARDVAAGSSTKQFVKRIGEKRDQLLRDYKVFKDPNIDIHLVNEQGEKVIFDTRDLAGFGFSGVVVVDCDSPIEKLHYGTIQRSLALRFPVAIMTRQDFLDLTMEVDTVPDLTYYLLDRFEFLKHVYTLCPRDFLDLNSRLERNLIAFYKTYENKFSVDVWEPEKALDYYSIYTSSLRGKILARNAENADSFIIDEIIDILRRHNTPTDSTLLHAWELAATTRRQRAGALAEKIRDALERMVTGHPWRHFAFFNKVTGCWVVFYFKYGGSRGEFRDEAERLTRYKLLVEMKERDFKFSVFCYAFRKSSIETGATFDETILRVEDSDKYSSVPENEYKLACQYFGKFRPQHIREFPT